MRLERSLLALSQPVSLMCSPMSPYHAQPCHYMEKCSYMGEAMAGHIMDDKVATEAMASQVTGSSGRFRLFLSGVGVPLSHRNRQFWHPESSPPMLHAHLFLTQRREATSPSQVQP